MRISDELSTKQFLRDNFTRIPEPNDDDETAARRRMTEGVNPVKAWREHRKMDLPDLATRTGLSLIRVRKIEGGLHFATQSDFHVISRALGIHPAHLVPPSGMPLQLLYLMRGAVDADNDTGRNYATQCALALKREADLAALAIERELIRLKRMDQTLAYRALRSLVKLEGHAAMNETLVDDVIDAVRSDAGRVRSDVHENLQHTNKQFEGMYYPAKDAWDAATDADFEERLPLLDSWRRAVGPRNLLEGMQSYPQYYGLANGPSAKMDALVGQLRKALVLHEMTVSDESDLNMTVRQIGYLDVWRHCKPGSVVIQRLRNRQLIMACLPGLVEPLAKKPVNPVSGPQFWLAKRGGPV